MSSYQFVNPYNFIPLQGKRAKTPQKPEGGDTYTGVIHYSVLTKTPLFIPNTSNQDAFCIGVEDHKSYDFFSYTDLSNRKGSIKGEYYMPVIPGSEMRGMLRSNFEILTNSCMSAIDDDVVLSKRTNETFEPGLLRKNENGTYDLYAAEDCLVRTKGKNSLEDDWAPDNEHYIRQCYIQDDILEGTKVHVEAEGRGKCKTLAYNMSTKERAVHNDEGYVIKGEAGPEMPAWNKKQQKHCCHVFIPYEDNIVQRDVPLDTLD